MIGFPPALAAALDREFDYADGEGVDFEPCREFGDTGRTASWLRRWTEVPLDAADFLVFGQDGTGGCAACRRVRDTDDLEAQPVALFGSEGEVGVVARNLGDFRWLLAGGFGPLEAVEYPDSTMRPDPELREIAVAHSPAPRTAGQVIAAARAEFPDFARLVTG
ncbi:SMI1/KNR4 family protein [Saccharothrix violaceirubra]|uniref:SMI1/KNR4 family protein n=1 Tax=Saccharothrix violaceirubra TaxID=413306 RepID=A0A7W7T5H0_9PSEU|nr:SMI1/KNR4 family protein [Saccharothrix violaceirubra]MBB4966641.1 hypothetical protein [Saccharothrix violaceirubra]